MRSFFHKPLGAFTLIELMITVAIIGVLAAVSVPIYQSYVRRSYLSEATSSIAAIKSAEESYFTINGCYVEAVPNPGAIPSATTSPWNSTATGWARNALSVRPDKNVRFQYRVFATNSIGCNAPEQDAALDHSLLENQTIFPNSCVATPRVGASGLFVDTAFMPDHWYVVVVQGDLNGDGTPSAIASAIDDSVIWQCNELE